jgi:glyoxylase I family protein
MAANVTGMHHITVRVNDMDASKAFYRDFLGFEVQTMAEDLALFQAGQTLYVLRPPLEGTPEGDRFSEYRIGVDHMAFAVEDRGELERLVESLGSAGVHTEGIEVDPTLGKEYVAFRDPDNIQLEFYMT